MPYQGHVKNGKVVVDEPLTLPDDTKVFIIERKESEEGSTADGGASRSLAERLSAVIGTVDGLPADASENVDHYLYGTPRK